MISYEQGRKSPNDKIVLVNGHQITLKEVAQIVIQLCKNEDEIYPQPKFKGRRMLQDFLNECIDKLEITQELLNKFKL